MQGFIQIPQIDSVGEAFAVGTKIEDSAEKIAKDHIGKRKSDGSRGSSKYDEARERLAQGRGDIEARLNPTFDEANGVS